MLSMTGCGCVRSMLSIGIGAPAAPEKGEDDSSESSALASPANRDRERADPRQSQVESMQATHDLPALLCSALPVRLSSLPFFFFVSIVIVGATAAATAAAISLVRFIWPGFKAKIG